jgi:hypothetical protein
MVRRRPGRPALPARERWGNQKEFAVHRRVSPQAVGKMVASGRIRLRGGRINFAEADRDLEANTDVAAQRGAAEEPGNPKFAEVRTAREVYELKLRRLEYEEKVGKLVSADEVRAAVFKVNRGIRDALLAIPPRIMPVLLGCKDAGEGERLLTEELRRVVAGLGQELKNGKPGKPGGR